MRKLVKRTSYAYFERWEFGSETWHVEEAFKGRLRGEKEK